MENGRISGGQLISIMFWTIMGTAMLSLPVLIGIHAPRDAWMAAVIFIIGGVALCFIIGALAKMFPGRDFVLYVQEVFGKWLGKVLIAIFLTWLFHTTSLVIWQITSFTKLSLLPNTPLLVISSIFFLPSIYAIYTGLEGIARSVQFIFTPTFLILLLLFLLHIPEVDLLNLMPIFDDGIPNILRASLAPLAWAGEIMFVLFLVPYIKGAGKTTFYSAITIILIGIGGILNEFFYTAVFGSLRQYLISPFYTIIRYIRPTAFVERYDIFFVTINLTGNFVKLSVFIYILVICLAQFFGMKNYRSLILPVAITLLILTNFTVRSSFELIHHLDTMFPLYTIPILYGFPLLTLIVGKIKQKFTNKNI